jgi:hypothetical protein
MKIAVIGSRNFNDYKKLCETLSQYEISEIVSGGAKGADSLAERYSKEYDIKITIFYPDWKKFGKSAGPIRNKEIIDYCDRVVAFWDGTSKGTKSSINIANRLKREVNIVKI